MRNKAQSNVSHSVKSFKYRGGHMGMIQRNNNIVRSRLAFDLAFDLHLALHESGLLDRRNHLQIW